MLGVVMTTWMRPLYLERTLESWKGVRGLADVPHRVSVDYSSGGGMQHALLGLAGRYGWEVRVQDRRLGVLHHPAVAIETMFADHPEVDFVVLAEEDLIVSADILEYFTWAAEQARHDQDVCIVSACSGVWTRPGCDDPSAVRLVNGWHVWVWGTWRDRWVNVIHPSWAFVYEDEGGWDHKITAMMTRTGKLSLVPDLTRVQNIGEYGGMHSTPVEFPLTLDSRFRLDLPPCEYRIT